jgi:hypothetical protein
MARPSREPNPLFAPRAGGALQPTDVGPQNILAPDGLRFLMTVDLARINRRRQYRTRRIIVVQSPSAS